MQCKSKIFDGLLINYTINYMTASSKLFSLVYIFNAIGPKTNHQYIDMLLSVAPTCNVLHMLYVELHHCTQHSFTELTLKIQL